MAGPSCQASSTGTCLFPSSKSLLLRDKAFSCSSISFTLPSHKLHKFLLCEASSLHRRSLTHKTKQGSSLESFRRDVSVAAKKSRSMREMEDEEEGFQSLVKKMDSQQKKPPTSTPAQSTGPQEFDPYADFAALLDYQDKNDGMLPPSKNTIPGGSSSVKSYEPVKPRVISRAGMRVAALTDLKVPTPVKKGIYTLSDEPMQKSSRGQSSNVISGGPTEYKLGESGAVEMSSQSDFPVRLKGHKMPKKKSWEVPKTAEVSEPEASNESSEEPLPRTREEGLAALQAGGLGAAKPTVNQEEVSWSNKGREYTMGEEGTDISVVPASSFPVRTKAQRGPKGGYSMGAEAEPKPAPPQKVKKRVPSYQELVSGAAKIVDPSVIRVAESDSQTEESRPESPPVQEESSASDGISGPKVYSLGEEDAAISVEAADSIPIRLKALKTEKAPASLGTDKAKQKQEKVAKKVPAFQLPADVYETGLLKKKSKAKNEKDEAFRPVVSERRAVSDVSGGRFGTAKQFLADRGVEDNLPVADAVAQLRGLREDVTSAQAEVLDKVTSLVERKMQIEAQGAQILPVVEGKVKVKGKKERQQITAMYPKWKEAYEKVCTEADYALRQLDGLDAELERSMEERKKAVSGSQENESKARTRLEEEVVTEEKPSRAASVDKREKASVVSAAAKTEDRAEKQTQALGELATPGEGTLSTLEGEDNFEEEDRAAGDEPPNWEDDPEDIDLSAYESDSDDEQSEGEAKPEFEVDIPPPRAEATEFSEKDAYDTFAAMLGDEDSGDDPEDSPSKELEEEESAEQESSIASIPVSEQGNSGSENPEMPETVDASDEKTATWDRESVSSQIFEMLQGTVEGETRQVDGSIEADSPPTPPIKRTLGDSKKRLSERMAQMAPEKDRTAQMDPDAIQKALDAARAFDWSDEVQSAVAKAEAEREMERKRRAPDYGTFDQLLKDEESGPSESNGAPADVGPVEDLTRTTRSPTLKDQRAPFVRAEKPPKPPVPLQGPSIVSPADAALARKSKWVRGLDFDSASKEEEDAARREWEYVQSLAPNKETVEVLVVNYNSGGLQALFGTLLGFIPASQLGSSRRPPRGPEWMSRSLMPKNLRNIPREESVTAQEPQKPTQNVAARRNPFDFDKVESESEGADSRLKEEPEEEEEVDYINSGIIPETDEQLAIAARQVRAYRTAHLASLVGQRLKVKVLIADRAQRKLIFSERAVEWKEGQGGAMTKLLERVKIGDVVTGTVKVLTKYGAFVEVEGAACLIHKSELAWVQPKHPGELLQPMQKVEAVVVAIDRSIRRVNLSLKRLQPDPLTETLDSLVERASPEGDDSILTEMPELGDIIKLLTEVPGIQEVRLGRRFRGTAFAPSFQIFLSEKVDEGYQLLARVGVEVQEVLVTTEIERADMKQAVRQAFVSQGTERRLALADFSS